MTMDTSHIDPQTDRELRRLMQATTVAPSDAFADSLMREITETSIVPPERWYTLFPKPVVLASLLAVLAIVYFLIAPASSGQSFESASGSASLVWSVVALILITALALFQTTLTRRAQ